MSELGYRDIEEEEGEKESVENHCAKSDFKYYIYYVSGHYYKDKNSDNYKEGVVSIKNYIII